ncbi:hypothetical protein HDK77DRAFT_321853 [Phyllosticta capitalensis]|uniref:uncharacterized protein n=1 Tax=Phyllosticta capitalensis TaxID=121624 RepID=UPI00312D1A16
MTSSHDYDSHRDARCEIESCSDGPAAPLTPASWCGEMEMGLQTPLRVINDVAAEYRSSRILARVELLEESFPAGVQKTDRLEEMVDRLSREVAALKEANAECQKLIQGLQMQVESLFQEDNELRLQNDARRKEIKNLQMALQVLDQDRIDVLPKHFGVQKEKQPQDVQREEPAAIESQKEMEQQRMPPHICRNEQITNLQQLLADHKDMMAHLVETNEDLLFDPKTIGFFGYSFKVNTVPEPDYNLHYELEPFIEALQVAAESVPARVIRKKLQYCLIGDLRTWYFSVLTPDERGKLAEGSGLTNWIAQLRKMWGRDDGIPAGIPTFYLKLHLPLSARPRSTMNFFMSATAAARKMGKDDTYSQLALACEHMEPTCRECVAPPEEGETVNEYIIRTDLALREKGYLM